MMLMWLCDACIRSLSVGNTYVFAESAMSHIVRFPSGLSKSTLMWPTTQAAITNGLQPIPPTAGGKGKPTHNAVDKIFQHTHRRHVPMANNDERVPARCDGLCGLHASAVADRSISGVRWKMLASLDCSVLSRKTFTTAVVDQKPNGETKE